MSIKSINSNLSERLKAQVHIVCVIFFLEFVDLALRNEEEIGFNLNNLILDKRNLNQPEIYSILEQDAIIFPLFKTVDKADPRNIDIAARYSRGIQGWWMY